MSEAGMTPLEKDGDKPVAPIHAMTQAEIDQFLMCARVGRIGVMLEEGPYVVPVGFGWSEGKVFFHSCEKGVKMDGIRANPNVCFEVDETLSDTSLSKSVIIMGRVEVIQERRRMIPYLQKLIDKYRVPVAFGEYMKRGGRRLDEELERVRICLITPNKMSGVIRACFFGKGIDKMVLQRRD
jgi:nitroimidazol reductase NimA-like FMN-containing flavoprotein (pyridoxamine 5'-phosphate oxidase superfamily)